jgi:hypothetical protein
MMKKPRTEITAEEAKFVLSAYRSGRKDTDDPVFHEALRLAEKDPELGRWFEEQQEFDSVVAEKLSSIAPPPHLHSTILAGLQAAPPAKRSRATRWLAIAAIALIGLLVIGDYFWFAGSPRADYAVYRRDALNVLNAGPVLDLTTADLQVAKNFIQERAAPLAPTLPEKLTALPAAGCKVFEWQKHRVSLTCFTLPDRELLHVLVIDANVFREPAKTLPAGMQRAGQWNVEFRVVEGKVLMFASRARADLMTRYI